MPARQIVLAFVILVARSTAKETNPTKRQSPDYFGAGADPRGLDPRIGLLGGHPRGRLIQLDPRAAGPLDPAQFQAFQLGFVPREPVQRQPPQYRQLLRLMDGNQDAGQGTPQQFLQQNLASRRPQQFSGPPPSAVRLSPEQIEQNLVQDAIASKGAREQKDRDVQRLQLLELEQYLQQRGISPEYLRQHQVQPQLIQRILDPNSEAGSQQRQAEAQAEAQARAQAEAQARAQAEAQARAQAEAQARAQAGAQARAQAEAQARAQAEAQARAQAEGQARARAESQARAQADAQVDAQKTAQAEEEERAQEEQSRAIAATLAARAQLQPSPKATAQHRHPQYILQQPQYESEPIPDAPERVSYSTVQFGSTKLPRPPRIFSSPPSPRQLIYQASHPNAPLPSPQPSPQPEYVEIPQQQIFNKQKTQYSPEQLGAYREGAVHPGIPEVIVKDRQTPNQYLIETTNFEANSRPVNRQPVFRPSALRVSPETITAQKVAEQRDRAIYTQQALEAATTPDSPSRSSIFVTTSRTPALRPQSQDSEIRQEGGRPLTQGELRALLNAGYKVHPNLQQPSFEEPSGVTYYQRGARLGKRQDKPIPKPVPLTEEERRALASEGIRGLYRIEPAGNEEGEHVRYVLALGKPLPGH